MQLTLPAVIVILSAWGAAAWAQVPQWYSQIYTPAQNAQITLKDAGGNNFTAITNPTGATVQAATAINTQPPTVIVQATGPTSWKDPVVSYTLLPATGNSVGDTRKVTSLGFDFWWNGTAWKPVAMDQNGNLAVPNNVSASTITPTLVVAENSSCTGYPSGAIAQSASAPGVILSCQSGVWVKLSGALDLHTKIGLTSYWPNIIMCKTANGWNVNLQLIENYPATLPNYNEVEYGLPTFGTIYFGWSTPTGYWTSTGAVTDCNGLSMDTLIMMGRAVY